VRERLAALTRAQELTRPGLINGKEAAGQDTTLHALIRAIFAPYSDPDRPGDTECLMLEGLDAPVRGSAVTSLALVLHELATNAAKYGALSMPGGMIRIRCAADGGDLVLTWLEEGGPALAGKPESEGFGSMLARRTFAGQFGGSIARDWRPEGLSIRMCLPLAALAGDAQPGATAA
jgi:two-component system CheB/CheR fusion protein